MHVAQAIKSLVQPKVAAASPPAIGPARAALAAQLARVSASREQRLVVIGHADAARQDARAAQAADAKVQELTEAIDAAHADARYTGIAADVTEQQRARDAAKAEAERLAPIARAALKVLTRYEADIERLTREQRELYLPIGRMTYDAVIEDMTTYHAALTAAEEALRVVHRQVYVRALAADLVSDAQHLGEFCDARRFELLEIIKPRVAPFEPRYADDFGAGRAHHEALVKQRDDWAALERDANALVHALLTGATDG
jgi:hypothetical protein